MRYTLFSLLAAGLLIGGAAFAQGADEAGLEAVEQAESVTLADLEVENAGLLPTSPFYFFKEWGRGMQSLFTFDKVAKAELEVKFANEKAAELKVVQEQKPDDASGIERAIANFERSQERLKTRLEQVQETSENPNVDRLLSKVAEKSVLHEKLLGEIKARHEDKETVRETIENAKEKITNVVEGLAGLDTAEKFTERLKNALVNSSGSALKDIRSVEFIDTVQGKLSQEVKTRLEGVREEFVAKVKEKIEIESEDGEKLQATLERIPGDDSKRVEVLNELRATVSDKAARALEGVQQKVQVRIQERALAPEAVRSMENNEGDDGGGMVCTEEYKPVCGIDDKTYSNRCVAEQRNRVKVAHEGECALTPSAQERARIEDQEKTELENQTQEADTGDSRQQQLEQQLQQQLQQLNQLQKQLQERQAVE